MTTTDVIVIGAGQAGLATSFHLTRLGIEHRVLDRGRVGETWRSRRWDSFTLVAPNWSFDLPGFPYDGPEPDGFMLRAEMVRRFETYAATIRAPLEAGVEVHRIRRDEGRGDYHLETSSGELSARAVVVATGAYQRPFVPDTALSPAIHQLHTDSYRNSDQLPPGAVLVVGSGQSGCQIAEDLRLAGRDVYLAASSAAWLPRRYRGRDNVRWRMDMGLFENTLEVLTDLHARTASPPIQSGRNGGRDLNLHTLASMGIVLAGRLLSAEGHQARFADDLAVKLQAGDDVARRWRESVDSFVTDNAVADAPPEAVAPPPAPGDGLCEFDLAKAGVQTVLWATGYRLDFGWINLDLFDADGYPAQVQGVVPASPGLYFIGLQWLHKRKSGLIFGVGDDAEHISEHAHAQLRAAVRR